MKILVTGKNGQLGQSIKRLLDEKCFANLSSFSFIFTGREELNLENLELTADYNLMNLISSKSNGTMNQASELKALENVLMADESQKPMIYSDSRTAPLIDYRWLFALVFTLLGIEWFLRRFKGSY